MSGHDDWREFLKQVDKLTAVKQRAIAAVIGALVADAACMFVCVACMHACMYVLVLSIQLCIKIVQTYDSILSTWKASSYLNGSVDHELS